jgi:hypothetical protein
VAISKITRNKFQDPKTPGVIWDLIFDFCVLYLKSQETNFKIQKLTGLHLGFDF